MSRQPSSDPFVRLDQPRALTDAEKWIARALAACAAAEVVDQVEQAFVVGCCRCGCSSVRLETHAPQVAAAVIATRSPRGRGDYLGVSARADRTDGTTVAVTLHVIQGTTTELELFDPALGEGHPVDPATFVALREIDLL